MKKYISLLKRTKLFSGIGENDIETMLGCLNASIKTYEKGEYVFRRGAYPSGITLLSDGKLHICKEDYWGNLSILNEIIAGDTFGESYAAPNGGPLLNDVVATERSTVFFFDTQKLLSACPHACPFHSQIVRNLFYIISDKNRSLVQKLGYMSKRSTREKLLSYLSDESKRQNSSSFTIPFNRQQLADFLSVDRSAMSNELCKMRNEGIISFNKNNFTLYDI